MSRTVEPTQRANGRRTVGLRTMFFVYTAAVAGLVMLGAIGVVMANRHRTEEDTARLVLRVALSRAEWEARRVLGRASELLVLAREWSENGHVDPNDSDALVSLLAPLLRGDSAVDSVRVVSNDTMLEVSCPADGQLVSAVHEIDEAGGTSWLADALTLCRTRDDDNRTGNPDIAWMPPQDGLDGGPYMMAALAFGPTTREVCIAARISLRRLADQFVALAPTPFGQTTIVSESGHILGMTGFRYAQEGEAEPQAARLVRDCGHSGLNRSFEYWVSNKSEAVFRVDGGDESVWASFREMPLGAKGAIVLGAVAPREDVTLLIRETQRDLVTIAFWGMAAALLFAAVAAGMLRRPLRVLADHLNRPDIAGAGQHYWPSSRITEICEIMEAVDALPERDAVSGGVRPGSTPRTVREADADVPQAQLQALFAARQELRESKTRVTELQRVLRARDQQALDSAQCAEEQRGRMRTLWRSEGFRAGDAGRIVQSVTEMAAASLKVTRASVWRYEEDGVFVCLDRFDASNNAHTSGTMLSRAEHRELLDALELEPSVSLSDLNEIRWMQRLAGSLGENSPPAAILVCPVRGARGIGAISVFEHAEGKRPWTVEEENCAILWTQLLSPFLQRTPVTAPESAESKSAWSALRDTQACWLMDAEARISWASDRIRQWTGHDTIGDIALQFDAFLMGADTAVFTRAWQVLIDGKPYAQFETPIQGPDAATRFVRVELGAMRRPDGTLQGAIGLASDITERCEAEKVARSEIASAYGLLDLLPVAVWRTDAAGRITYINTAVKRIYGYEPDALLGKPFDSLDSGGDCPRSYGRVLEQGGSNTAVRVIVSHRRADGSLMDVEIVASASHGGDGEPSGAAGILVPVEECTQLREAGHVLRFLGGRDEYIVLGVDREGIILWLSVSPELQERYENDLRGMMGQSLLHYFRSQRIEEQDETFRRAVGSHSVLRTVFAAQFAGGSYEQEATYIPLLSGGETSLVLIFIRDITAAAS